VELPVAMQQVMAMQAEAIREKRARIIKAEAELEASVKLSAAAAQITANPAALELRRMQMISEVGAENNSTTVIMIPSDFVSLAHNLSEQLMRQANAGLAEFGRRVDAALNRAQTLSETSVDQALQFLSGQSQDIQQNARVIELRAQLEASRAALEATKTRSAAAPLPGATAIFESAPTVQASAPPMATTAGWTPVAAAAPGSCQP